MKMLRTLLLTVMLLYFTFVYGNESNKNSNKITSKATEKLEMISLKHGNQNYAKSFKIRAVTIIPMLIGGLLKLVAMIPLILIVAVLIGTVSLIGSKLSLLISAILGVRTLLSLIPADTKHAKMMNEDDLNDIKQLTMKYAAHTANNEHLVYPKRQAFANPNYAMHQNMDLDNYYGKKYFVPIPVHNGLMESVITQFANDENIDDLVHVASVPNLDNGNDAVYYFDNKINDDRLKLYAATEMAAKANTLLEKKSATNPNSRVGVKITKTVVKHAA